MKLFSRIILTITLSVLTILLVLSLSSKKIIESIIKETWKSVLPTEILDNEYLNNAKDWLDEKLQSEEVNKISDWIKDKTKNENTEEVKNWFNDNTEHLKDKILNSEEFQTIKDTIGEGKIKDIADDFINKQEKKMSFFERIAFRLLRFLANAKIKGLLIIGIIINIILLILSSWSLYKWLKNIFISLILSGAGLYMIEILIKKAITSIIKVDISLDIIKTPATIMTISGIFFLIIYFIIVRIIKMNIKNNKGTKKED